MTKVLQWLSIPRKKKSRQCKVLGNINHLCLLADCMQNLPENMKPCSGPLIETIISVTACAASALSTSLKSINENVCRVFQGSFTCMNDLESKHIYTQTNNYFCTYFSWGYGLNNTSFCIFFTHYLIIRVLRRLSLVQSVAPRWIPAEIICLHVYFLALGVIFMHASEIIDIHQNSGFVLFLHWRSCCKPSFKKDTCLFWLKFPNKWSAITNFNILRELDRG